MRNPIIDVLVPERCLSCGTRAQHPWCARCRSSAERLRVSVACRRCAARPGDHGCWPEKGSITATTAAFRYHGVVADAVVGAKVRGAWSAWPALGEELADAAADDLAGTGVDLVTWVPTSPRRRRERGFDHARELARAVARRVGRPLVRTLDGADRADQGGQPASQRPQVPDAAFVPRRDLSGGRVALVDDVLTTGGTAWSATGALTRAGAAAVHLVVFARAADHDLRAVFPRTPATGPSTVLP